MSFEERHCFTNFYHVDDRRKNWLLQEQANMNQFRKGFLRDNFVVIENAFCRKLAAEWVANFNQINGIEIDNPSTWPEGGAKMYPSNQQMHMSDFSPLAYQVICDFLGGENQIETRPMVCGSMGTQPFYVKKYGRLDFIKFSDCIKSKFSIL